MKKILFGVAMLGLFATPAMSQEMPKEGEMPKEAPKEDAKKEDAKKDAPKRERPNRQRGNWMKQFDKNEDGKISKEEGGERLARMWDRLDKNKDGFITEDEMPQRGNNAARNRQRGAGPAAVIKLMDSDGDGKVSKEEAPKKMADNFGEYDKNEDGLIDAREMAAAMGAGDRANDRMPRRDAPKREKGKDGEKGKDMPRERKRDDNAPERDTGPSERDIEKGRSAAPGRRG